MPVSTSVDNQVSVKRYSPLAFTYTAEVDAKNPVYRFYSKSADFSFTLPLGFKLIDLIAKNQTANAAVLSLGTTNGGAEIYPGFSIPASGSSLLAVNLAPDFLADNTIYFGASVGDDWNGATIDVYVTLKKIL